MNKFSQGELYISSHFVSEKQPGSQKLLWNGFIISVFVLIGRGWPWTCMIAKKHNQLFRNVYPGKLHKRVFFPPLWPPFWIVSVVELQVKAAPGETGTPGKFLSDISPPLASRFLHSRQPLHSWYWIPPTGTSEYNSCRGGREWEQTLGYCSDFSLLGWEISHFLVVTEQIESWLRFYNLCNWFYVLLKFLSDFWQLWIIFPFWKGEGARFPSAQLWVSSSTSFFPVQCWNTFLGPRWSLISKTKLRQLLCPYKYPIWPEAHYTQSANSKTPSQLRDLYWLPSSLLFVL